MSVVPDVPFVTSLQPALTAYLLCADSLIVAANSEVGFPAVTDATSGRHTMIRTFSVALLVVTTSMGCTSISSTLLNRTDNDVFIGNSNGEPNSHCGARPFKGVPITLRVPTHLDVAIKEKIFLRKLSNGNLVRVQTKQRSLFVEPTVIETDKVFTVDPKRPAAGTLTSTLTWGTDQSSAGGADNSQYFASIVNNIKDETIVDVTAALNTLLPTLKGLNTSAGDDQPGGGAKATLESQLITESRTVAWKRFDLDAVGFEHEVADFVSQHMNCCNSCEAYGNNNSFDVPPKQNSPAPATDPGYDADPGSKSLTPSPVDGVNQSALFDPITTPAFGSGYQKL